MQYDAINWENVNEIYTEKNYSLARIGLGKFYHLFSHHGNHKFLFINGKSSSGYDFVQGVPHDAIIDIYDYSRNKVEIHAYFVSDTLPHFNYTINFKNDGCIATFIGHDFVRPYFYLTGTDDDDPVTSAEYLDMGNNIYRINKLIPPFNVLQISAKNRTGISSSPTFHMAPQYDFDNIEGNFKIKHSDNLSIISFGINF